jgi:hypothetical protein
MKLLISAAAALTLGLGAMSFSAAPAEAATVRIVTSHPGMVRVCKDTYRTVVRWRNHRRVVTRIKTGRECHWVRRYRHR